MITELIVLVGTAGIAKPASEMVFGVLGEFLKPIAAAGGKQVAALIGNGTEDQVALINAQIENSVEVRALRRMCETVIQNQVNLERVVQLAFDEVKNENGTPPSHEFNNVFREEAQHADTDELRGIWAKLLVSEFRNPGAVSKRAMLQLRALDRAEAELFYKVLAVAFNNKHVYAMEGGHKVNYADLWFEDLVRMVECGLVASESIFRVDPREMTLLINGLEKKVFGASLRYPQCLLFAYQESKAFHLDVFGLTLTGQTLAKSLDRNTNIVAIKEVVKHLTKRGISVALCRDASNGNYEMIKEQVAMDDLDNLSA